MSINSFLDRVIPAVVGYATGGATGAVTATVRVEKEKSDERKQKQRINAQNQKLAEEQNRMSEFFGSNQDLSTVQAPRAGMTTANAGFGAGFGNFLTDVGRNIINPVSGIINAFRTPQNNQQPAITTIGGGGAQESQGSGSLQAGLGGLVPAFNTARNFLTSPGGQIATGIGASLGLSMLGGDSRPMRYPTKQVRIVKAVYNQTGRDLMMTSQILGIDPQNVSQMIMQKLPAPNPAPTASAIKKTRSTIRKLDRMCNLRDEIAKSAKTTTRRRAPMRRASTTTLIKN
jgi:hypothetical protein